VRERYSRSGDNAKMKVLTFARNEDDLTDNSRTPTGTKSYFRSPSPSQNSLVLKFPIVVRCQRVTQRCETASRLAVEQAVITSYHFLGTCDNWLRLNTKDMRSTQI